MKTRKICMIGDFGVGKTSLVERYVNSVFSDRYLTTVGVKISSREQALESGAGIKFILWDIAGTSALSSVEEKYLRGASAYLLVVDRTRALTMEAALNLDARAQEILGPVPRLLMVNKQDLMEEWELAQEQLSVLAQPDRPLLCCSARSGENVDQAFALLAERLSDA